jgi:MHS family proline/betaine transporter-like MFS transporter
MSSSILGGTAPFVAVWLNSVTGNSLGFSAYLVFFAIVTLVITLICARRWIAESAGHSGDVATRNISTVNGAEASLPSAK